MNERIRELFVRAGGQFGHYGEPILPDIEVFTELIVRETMQVVANNLPQNTYLDVADAVIEHFKE